MAAPAAILSILVSANTTAATASLARTDAQLKKTAATANSSAATTSTAASRGTAALTAFGKAGAMAGVVIAAASTKMAYDFEGSMREIRDLVGSSEKQVEQWGDAILAMSGKVGKAPIELADALYYVSSSGIKTSKVLSTVEVAAKASAIGLGETETIANALTSAMNAYAKSGLSAEEATNVLIKTVKFGKLEADSLAQSIGRVIPVSSKLGVGFDDVGASLAAMSLQGLDAAEATTALRAIFTSIIKPTDASETALSKVGLSAEKLRSILAQKGTLYTLELLSEKLKGNVEAMGAVFPNVRALVGAFNLTGENGKQVAEIFDGLAKNTDDVNKAFKEWSQTDAAKIDKAWAGMQASLVRIGGHLLPVVAELMEKTVTLMDKLSDPGSLFSQDRLNAVDVLAQNLTSQTQQYAADALAAMRASGKKINERMIWDWVERGKITAAGATYLIQILHDLNKTERQAFKALAVSMDFAGDGVADFAKQASGAFGNLADKGKGYMKTLALVLRDPFAVALDKTGNKIKTETEQWNEAFGGFEKGTSKTTRKVTGSFNSMVNATGDGLTTMKDNVNKALKGFGVKKTVGFSIATAGGAAAKGFQTGGKIVPGSGNGDKVPAMLEPGEVVWNKKAVAALGGANKANSVNNMIPRFASGGVIPGVSLAGVNPTVIGFVQGLYNRFGGTVGSGFRPGDDGDHGVGDAIDYSPSDWTGASRAVNASGPSLKQGIYNPGTFGGSPVSWSGGSQVPSSYWAEEWGNHLDHIHIAIAAGAKVAVGAAIENIKRVMLKGPDGPLKDMGQGALDKTWKAANAYLAKQMPTTTGDSVVSTDSGGPVVSQMGKFLLANKFSRAGASGIIGNAYRESLWNPGSIGSGGGGLFGFTTSPVSLADMQNYAANKGKPWTDVETQMEFMLSAPSGGGLLNYGDLTSYLRSTGDIPGATSRFMNEWERPAAATAALDIRTDAAQQAFGMGSWQEGGIIQKLAKGGKIGGEMAGDFPAALYTGAFGKSKAIKALERLSKKVAELMADDGPIAVINEMIDRDQTLFGMAGSADGSDLSASEITALSGRYQELLAKQTLANQWSQTGVSSTSRLIKRGLNPSDEKIVKKLLEGFKTNATQLSGLTGSSGDIFTTQMAMAELLGTSTGATSAMDLSGLRSVIEAARYGVFDSMPKFHQGGVVPGAPSQQVPIMARGGEVVSTSGGVNVTNNFSFDEFGMLVETYVDDRLAKRERIAHKKARQYSP